ncbi:hypothetical protein OROHE_011116 [Orobanche hederae]
MEFTDRGINPQDSPPVPPIYSYLTDKNLRADSIGSYIGQTHQEFFPDGHLRHLHHLYSLPSQYLRHSLPSPNPRDLHEGIQIEIEKEKIREEILITEAARRRVLEAEVRRELMMERSAMLTSGHGFSFRSSPQMDFASPAMIPPRAGEKMDEGSLEERITSLLNGKRESGRFFETQATIQRGTIVKPVSQARGDLQKKKYIFLGNPDENVSGLKKKAVTPPRVDTTNFSSETPPFVSNEELGVSEDDKPVSEGGDEKQKLLLLEKPDENISGSKRKASDFPPSSGGIVLHKKNRENWFCAICHINSTSERAHNDHVQGRKHKWKEEAFRAAKIYSSSTKEHLPDKGTTDDAKPPVTLKKYNNVVKSGNPVSRNYPFWCELCNVGTSCVKDISTHEKGRKHLYRLSQSAEKANCEECVAEDGKDVTKGNRDGIVNREFGKTENNPEFVETAKPENHSDKISVFVSDEAEDEKDVTNDLDGITNNEFVNPVKTENKQELVVEEAKTENYSDNMSMFVSDGDEDGKNVIKGGSDVMMKPEENHEIVVEMAKTENHSDNFAMFVSDGAEDGNNVIEGDFDGIMKPEDNQEIVESARSDSHLDKISMLVSDGKNVINGSSDVILKPEDNQELVVETAKSDCRLDKSSMLVSDDGKNVTRCNFDGNMDNEFVNPVETENDQELRSMAKSEYGSYKISMLVIDDVENVRNEMKGNFDGIMNNEFVNPEYNQVLVEAAKSENHSDKISMFVRDNAEEKKNTAKGNFIRIMNNEFANPVKSENHSDKIAMLVSANVEDEKSVTKGHFDGIMDNEFANPVKTESNQDLVLGTEKSENHSDKNAMLVIEDVERVTKDNFDGIINKEFVNPEHSQKLVETAKYEIQSDNISMLVIDNPEDEKIIMEGNCDVIINREFVETERSQSSSDNIPMLVIDNAEDDKTVMEGNFDGIINHESMDPIATEKNQELVVEMEKSENQSDKISMLVSANAEVEKNEMADSFDGIINPVFMDPVVTEANQELVVEIGKSEDHSDNAEDEENVMGDNFDGIINHEFMDPIVTEDNQEELVVETGKPEDHSNNAEDEKIVMEYNSDGTINHEFSDPVKAENSQQLALEAAKSEDHEDEILHMMEEDDWSAYITELENGVTDDMVVDRGDDGGIMSLVENFVLDADL